MMGSWINAMADPDLQIRMGVGGVHPDPEIRFFRPLRPQFSLKISGVGVPRVPPLDPPL